MGLMDGLNREIGRGALRLDGASPLMGDAAGAPLAALHDGLGVLSSGGSR